MIGAEQPSYLKRLAAQLQKNSDANRRPAPTAPLIIMKRVSGPSITKRVSAARFARNTLANANTVRDWRIYAEMVELR
jgi:hypothetical protein